MSKNPSFDLQQLQRQYPDAFYLRLRYSRFKFIGALENLNFCFCIGLLVFSYCILSACLYLFMQQMAFNASYNMIGVSLFAPAFLYSATAQHQAKFSSLSYAKRLQRCLYGQFALFMLLTLNLYSLASDTIAVCGVGLLCLISICTVLIEALFKPNSSAIEHVKLQQIRQLAYWSYLQAQKTTYKNTAQTNQKQHYEALHLRCMQEEQALMKQIRFNNLKTYLQEK